MGKNPWQDLHKQIQRNIGDLSNPIAAQIVTRLSNGNYHVKTFDGLDLYNVKNQTRTKWSGDQWVAIENIGGDWMITGLSSSRGGT